MEGPAIVKLRIGFEIIGATLDLSSKPTPRECSPIPTFPEPPVAQPRRQGILCPCRDRVTEVLKIQEKVTAKRVVYHYDSCSDSAMDRGYDSRNIC
ncbi:hypothetical protein V6N11_039349 [Hibiscus sabdariffa]|uniref:Uncharacterized protein n=1 Tax=Hibiscus sabdariffa TaxID=183260 RepID=A0ABR2SNC7_9ROSI